MQLNIHVRHTEIPQAIKDYIEKKSKKFSRFFDRIQEILVIIEEVKFSFEVEFIIKSDLFTVQAKERGTDLRSTIDQVIHIVERKLKKEKDKIIKDKKRTRQSLRHNAS